jgi:hypothetical protein
MSTNAIRPEDILSDTQNIADFNGLSVRKGSIAAFLKNIDLLENANASQQEKIAALDMINELAQAVIAAGLHKHANFKNKAVQEILDLKAKFSKF